MKTLIVVAALWAAIPGVDPGTCQAVEEERGLRVWCNDSTMVRVVEDEEPAVEAAAPPVQPVVSPASVTKGDRSSRSELVPVGVYRI